MSTLGLLLAAGAGTRMGRPKALVDDWLVRSVETLADCDRVVVVLGALLFRRSMESVLGELVAAGESTPGDAAYLVGLVARDNARRAYAL